MSANASRWRSRGVRIIRADELDDNTPQTLGMFRRAAITTQNTGANKLWAGTVTINPRAKTGPHHHGDLESVIYVVRGLARLRWGERLEYVAEAAPGDFIYVPHMFRTRRSTRATSSSCTVCWPAAASRGWW